MLREVHVTRYVTPLREGGSLPALVEADDDGLYVLKLKGAGQGSKALIADLLGGEIARALGLRVPELVLARFDPAMAGNEPDPEIRDPLLASGGLNLGVDFLPGSLALDPVAVQSFDPELATRIAWLDAYIMNVDRTARNPNILAWHREPWLIDHGAALYFHHTWEDWEAKAASPFAPIRDHVLLGRAGSLQSVGGELAGRLGSGVLQRVVETLPDEWLDGTPFDSPGAVRAAYVRFLELRLAARAAFEREADRRHA